MPWPIELEAPRLVRPWLHGLGAEVMMKRVFLGRFIRVEADRGEWT